LKELYIEFDTSDPQSGVIVGIQPSQMTEIPGSYSDQMRQSFTGRRAQLVEEKRKIGGDVVGAVELVHC
jgi:hypothetical protein